MHLQYCTDCPPQKKKITIGPLASITFEIVNYSGSAFGLGNYNTINCISVETPSELVQSSQTK